MANDEVEFKLGDRWTEKFANRIERFEFEVGVLDNKARREPKPLTSFQDVAPTLGNFAGGPVSKLSTDKSQVTNAQVLIENMERLNTNLLKEPFQDSSSELNRFTKAFMDLVLATGMSQKRVENLLQAVVRNPILKLEYGSNSAFAADGKGFDRHLFHTGQMFKSIIARTINVRKKS